MNGSNKQECEITLGLKGLSGTNTLAYCTHSSVIKKMKCCENGSRLQRLCQLRFLNFHLVYNWEKTQLPFFFIGVPYHKSIDYLSGWLLQLRTPFLIMIIRLWWMQSLPLKWYLHRVSCCTHIDIILNRLINGTHCLLCFALLEMLVPAKKIHFKEQVLAEGKK